MPEPRRIVVLSLEDWDEVWRRNQYLVDSLLVSDPGLEVVFVEPATDPLHALSRGRAPRRGRGLRTVDGYDGRLRTFQPTKWLPRRFGASAESQLNDSVLSALRRLGWSAPYLWINDPRWLPLLRSTGWRSLYDITDDWAQAERGAREHELLVASDVGLLESCDEVVVCSPSLSETKGSARPVTLIRNAVDVARYRTAQDRPSDLPAEAVALYVGTLHEDRLDVDLVVRAGSELFEVGARLVLVGPNALTSENRTRLASAPGVVALGSRPRETIPAYLQHAHVLVVPHVIDEFTDSLDPIKLYEYLAVGRPIVSTAVAGFRQEPGTRGIVIADGDAFVAAVAEAVAVWDRGYPHPDVPDWPSRGREMLAVIDRLAAAGEPIA